jgi:hypothetical protein
MANIVKYKKTGNMNLQGSILADPINPVNVPSPASGKFVIFNDSTDNSLSIKNSAGTVSKLIPEKWVQITVTDAAVSNIVLGSILIYRSFKIEYTIDDGTNYRKGIVEVLHDGSNANVSGGSYFDIGTITGISLNADISSGNARLNVTSSGVGSSFEFVYKIVDNSPLSI